MLNIFRNLIQRLLPVRRMCEAPDVSWRCDPLSHPDLRAMSARELGDTPFDPTRFC